MTQQFIDKHGIKIQVATAVTVIGVIIMWSFFSGQHVSNLDNAIINLKDDCGENTEKIKILEEDNKKQDLQYTEINTKLTGIEVTLAEIKQDIKNR